MTGVSPEISPMNAPNTGKKILAPTATPARSSLLMCPAMTVLKNPGAIREICVIRMGKSTMKNCRARAG
jgi:hypothetical protein